MALRRAGVFLAAFAAFVVLSPSARGAAFERYTLTESFALPEGGGAFDVLSDGRLVTVAGSQIMIETSAGSRAFASAGTLPAADFNAFGPAFVRVSPDGRTVAIGNGGGASFGSFQVGVFDLTALSGAWFDAGHFDAEWIDARYLALTAGSFGSPAVVTRLDTLSAPAAPTNPTIVDGIGGASAGITFDAAGRLYTGNGFRGAGPSETGAIKAFDKAAWQAALLGGAPADFESEGTLVADVLSATSLGFDIEGNLFAGGGADGDSDYAALLRSSAVADALAGAGPVGPADTRRLDPDAGSAFNFYDVNYGPATGELYVRELGVVYVYVVPEAGTWAMLAVAAMLAHRRVMRRRVWGGEERRGSGLRLRAAPLPCPVSSLPACRHGGTE